MPEELAANAAARGSGSVTQWPVLANGTRRPVLLAQFFEHRAARIYCQVSVNPAGA
jgi:hypothetical protein